MIGKWRPAAGLLFVALLVACGQPYAEQGDLDGNTADSVQPAEPAAAPVAVLVPGGGWVDADRSGLKPLADALAERGIFAVNTTYRAAGAGGDIDSMVRDVVCAMAFAARQAAESTSSPQPVVPIGHSAGAHLVALAVLADDTFSVSCPDPLAEVAGFVGLAGPYDIARIPEVALPMFGTAPTADPDRWRAGNPLTYATAHPALPVLLVHGDADELVPIDFTTEFADAMTSAGHDVEIKIVRGATHLSIFDPAVSGDIIADWLLALNP